MLHSNQLASLFFFKQPTEWLEEKFLDDSDQRDADGVWMEHRDGVWMEYSSVFLSSVFLSAAVMIRFDENFDDSVQQ